MSATGLMILGPGLGRFVIVFCGVPVQFAIPLIISFSGIISLVWLILDIKNKKPAFPMAFFLGITFISVFININGQSAWWQSFAGWVVNNLY